MSLKENDSIKENVLEAIFDPKARMAKELQWFNQGPSAEEIGEPIPEEELLTVSDDDKEFVRTHDHGAYL